MTSSRVGADTTGVVAQPATLAARVSRASRLRANRFTPPQSAGRSGSEHQLTRRSSAWYRPHVKLSVVIPVYNEVATLKEIVRRVVAVAVDKELVIVDDGSTDGSRELLADLRDGGLAGWLPAADVARAGNDVRVVLQPRNAGKGAALRAGFAATTGDIVIVQDADLEYDPADIPRVIQPILDGDADVVFGSRFIGASHRVLYFWHMVVNRGLTLLSNMFNDLNLTDIEIGYKAFRSEIAKAIVIEEDRFGVEPELTAKVAKMRLRIYEVPVSYRGRTYDEGKKIGWKDGVRAVYCIVKYGIGRRR
jgi:glycosyltransferase involved in cell wall biosynthesis